MIIEYIIANDRGDHLAKSTFDNRNSAQRRQFALRARVAWEDGHAVITRRAPTKEITAVFMNESAPIAVITRHTIAALGKD